MSSRGLWPLAIVLSLLGGAAQAVTVQNCKVWNDFWMGWPIGSGLFAQRSPALSADHNLMFEFEQGITLLQSPRARITPDDLKTFDSDYNNPGTYIRAEAPTRPLAEEDFKPAADDFFRNSQSKAVAALNGERYYSLGDWRAATGQEAHSIFAHPQFTDPEHWDFTLRPDSPNIGAGENGG